MLCYAQFYGLSLTWLSHVFLHDAAFAESLGNLDKIEMKKLLSRLFMWAFVVFCLVQVWIFSSLLFWKVFPVDTTMFMRIAYFSKPSEPIQHEWRDYEDISNNFKFAVVAAEDGKFMQHHGFDWSGIEQAILRNSKKGQVVAGGSTISQQLAKNLFLYNQRSFIRKGQEALATAMMEMLWSKHRILEVYMNSVELGDRIYGVEAASQHYFGKSARRLSREQAALLAAMLPNPRYYQEHRQDRKLQYRKRMILRYMRHSQVPSNQ